MTWFGSLDLRPETVNVLSVPLPVSVVLAEERSADCWRVRLSVWFGAVPVIEAAAVGPEVTVPMEREFAGPTAPVVPGNP